MKKAYILPALVVLVIGAEMGLRLLAHAGTPDFPKSSLTIDTADGQHHKFAVEVARTQPQQEYGLMFRRQMPEDAGMIFLFAPQVITMWMKNTYIPLDMVFLDKAGTVTHVEENAKPESEDIIYSGGIASAVIELDGGVVHKLGIANGDKVESPDLASFVPDKK